MREPGVLTKYIADKGAGIIKLEPEVSDPTGQFLAFDDGGVEAETGEFLYGLVRLLKPTRICETGTYSGISSMYMAQALKDNDLGQLITLEVEQFHKERAEKLWRQVGVSLFVSCQQVASLDYQTKLPFDMLFLDSEPEFRFKEFVKFYPNVKGGGYILIHDLHHHLSQEDNKELGFGWPFSELPWEIVQWLKEDKLRFVPFPTPRGLAMFYKTKEGDYNPYDERFKKVPSL